MLPFVPDRRARVLEIGCSEGRFSSALDGVQERWGIEPSPAAELARTRLDRVFQATFEQAEPDLPQNYFDLVICNDVIEHMPDHCRFLRNIKNHIAPGGMLIGSIPNVRYYQNMFQFLLEKDWNYTDFGILDRTHVSFFTEKSLRKTLERSGFEIVQMKGINTARRSDGAFRDKAYLAAAFGLSVLTLGYFSDIRHLQFAFQAKPQRVVAEEAARGDS